MQLYLYLRKMQIILMNSKIIRNINVGWWLDLETLIHFLDLSHQGFLDSFSLGLSVIELLIRNWLVLIWSGLVFLELSRMSLFNKLGDLLGNYPARVTHAHNPFSLPTFAESFPRFAVSRASPVTGCDRRCERALFFLFACSSFRYRRMKLSIYSWSYLVFSRRGGWSSAVRFGLSRWLGAHPF